MFWICYLKISRGVDYLLIDDQLLCQDSYSQKIVESRDKIVIKHRSLVERIPDKEAAYRGFKLYFESYLTSSEPTTRRPTRPPRTVSDNNRVIGNFIFISVSVIFLSNLAFYSSNFKFKFINFIGSYSRYRYSCGNLVHRSNILINKVVSFVFLILNKISFNWIISIKE